jgi:hypothetical protein
MGMGYSESAAGRLDTGFDLLKPNRKVGGDEVGGHGIDDFWVNFRQEDRICRKGGCGAAAVAVLLRALRLRRDKVTGNLVAETGE